ncbi:lantibiotic dehydratase [Actinomadura sp. NEAU-AAG7]|uniref:lantibiotic dehydratase n=1 Tax=Actinomadura sp. NEAU-AAG7 TaxID=2839640 RepID=UPI001BE435C9|nr:lantibiotic dehydratase [Actinomadura sp. NEAU-AAG7]MBT2207835.1 lantibiotic dehydratase [Actinomadura sp. NEAU-AAG7]
MSENLGTVSGGITLDGGARADAPLVLRRAGLPAAALDVLRTEKAHGCARELARLRAWLAAEGAALSDVLFAEIGAVGDGGPKPRLVGLRRAVFRSRRPRPEEWNAEVEGALGPEAARRVREWLARFDEADRLAARLPGVLAAEVAEREQVLRGVASDPCLRRALSQASPALYGELAKWLDDPRRRPRPQTMARLVKYVARAAAKTSPYSTFTISGLAVWGEREEFAEQPVHGVVELDGFLLRSIVRALCEVPALRATLTVRANPGAVVADGRVSFPGPPPREPIVTLPETPAVRACLRLLAAGPPGTLAALADVLAPGGRNRERVEGFLAALVEAGLLILDPPVADQAADPLRELSAWAARGGEETADVVPLLERLRREVVPPVPVEDVEGHRARQDRLRDAASALVERLGLPFPVTGLSKSVFHENAVFGDVPAECSVEGWRPLLDDLDAVRHWLAVFDPALPLRLALGAFCGERFGAGARVPFLELFRAVHEEMNRGDGAPGAARELVRFLRASPMAGDAALAGSPLERLRELGRIRDAARRAVLVPADADGVVRAPVARLRALAARSPEWIGAPVSMGCYVQRAGDLITLNVAHAGYGRGRSRIRRLTGFAGGTVPPERPFDAPPGTVFAELGGTFASALNARAPGTAYEIDYPHTVSARPAPERLPLGDLDMVHDPRTGLADLVSRRLGERVVPLHLGMMADVLLPPVARFLTWAFGASYYLHPSFSPLAPDWEPPTSIVAAPRVEAGRVVLRRARWSVPTGLVPARRKAESDADHLVRLVGWLRANGIPGRCYVRMWADGLWQDDAEDNNWGKWVLDKSRKPVYIDFAIWHLVAVFERMLKTPGPVIVFEEALPEPTAAGAAGGFVSEFLVEISGGVA